MIPDVSQKLTKALLRAKATQNLPAAIKELRGIVLEVVGEIDAERTATLQNQRETIVALTLENIQLRRGRVNHIYPLERAA